METVTGIDLAGRAVLIGERRMPSAAAQIFVVGDTCLSKSWDSGIAPAAKQMGAPVRRGRSVDFARASRLIENDNRTRPRVRKAVHRHASEEESHAGQE
jgi:hypothetical protein